MAFEPLKTDEKLEKPIKKGPDMDSQMLGGCSVFVFTSFATYALGIWPFFLLTDLHLLQRVLLACALGMGPAAVLGAVFGARGGLAPACGFFGGAVTVAVFLYLSLRQVALGHTLPDLPRPDYPPTFSALIPIAWVACALLICVVFAQIGERRRTRREETRR